MTDPRPIATGSMHRLGDAWIGVVNRCGHTIGPDTVDRVQLDLDQHMATCSEEAPVSDLDGSGQDDELILRPGDVLAAGLADNRCLIGRVTAVNDRGIRLNLWSPSNREFVAGTAVVLWSELEHAELGTAAGVERLAEFAAGWMRDAR